MADTELYDKVDFSKPETVGLSLFNQVWGQSPEKGAVSLTKTLSDPSMTGRGFACESSLLGCSAAHLCIVTAWDSQLPPADVPALLPAELICLLAHAGPALHVCTPPQMLGHRTRAVWCSILTTPLNLELQIPSQRMQRLPRNCIP